MKQTKQKQQNPNTICLFQINSVNSTADISKYFSPWFITDISGERLILHTSVMSKVGRARMNARCSETNNSSYAVHIVHNKFNKAFNLMIMINILFVLSGFVSNMSYIGYLDIYVSRLRLHCKCLGMHDDGEVEYAGSLNKKRVPIIIVLTISPSIFPDIFSKSWNTISIRLLTENQEGYY